jgi:predicted glycosyltransferase
VRSLLFCNEMLGLGHLRLSMAIAGALVADDPASTALVVTGSPALGGLQVPERVDVMKLPGLPVEPGSRWSATDRRPPAALELPAARIHALRAELSLAAVAQLDPDITLVDYLPLGRGEELRPALSRLVDAQRPRGGVVALGLWDVDDAAARLREAWTPARRDALRRYYDLALVYGPPAPDDVRVGELRAAGVAVHTTDLVAEPPAERAAGDLGSGYLLATVGGGIDGYPLLRALLDTLALRPLPCASVLIAGPMMAASEVAALRQQAAGLNVRIEADRPDFPAVLAGARAVVSMAGYCSVAEILASGQPALLVPRAFPRQEQLNRARRHAAAGLVGLLEPDELEPARLRAALDELLARPARAPRALQGAAQAAELLRFTVGAQGGRALRRGLSAGAP